MRVVLLLLAVSACAKNVEAEREASLASTTTIPPATATTKATAPPTAARFPCGPKTCEATQYCVRVTMGNATTGGSFDCWNSLAADGGGMTCTEPDQNRQVTCQLPTQRAR